MRLCATIRDLEDVIGGKSSGGYSSFSRKLSIPKKSVNPSQLSATRFPAIICALADLIGEKSSGGYSRC